MYEIIEVEGFSVLLNHMPNSQTCKIEAMIGDGFIRETKKNCGISHFVEHVISESWNKCFKDGCSKFWTDYGAFYNAETTDNVVMYYIEGFIKDINIMLDFICKIVVNPEIPTRRLEKEKKAVINEIMSDPKVVADLDDAMNKIIYKNEGLAHNCDRDLQVKNLKKFNTRTVRKWVEDNYCQDNIIFVISGNFDKKSVIKKMKSILKHKKNKKNSQPESHSIFNLGNSFTHLSAPQKEDATVLFLFPYKYDRPNLHMIYSDFFQMLVGSSIQSIIMFELREKLDLIYTSDAELTTYPSSGLFTLDISTKKQNVNQVIKKTIEILEMISNGKFATKILENLKKQFILTDLQESANNDFYTRFYGLQLMNNLASSNKNTRIFSYKETVEVIDKLKKKEFVKFIKSILNFDDMKVIYQM